MSRRKFLIITLFTLLFLLFALSVSMYFLQKSVVTKTPSPTIAPIKEATIFLSPSSSSFEIGKPVHLDIKIKGPDLVVSAIAVRIVYHFGEKMFLEPQVSTMNINTALLTNGWISPINTISIDSAQGEVLADLALVNGTPTGFVLEREETIATIDFLPVATGATEIRFDQKQTAITSKTGEKVKLLFGNASYTIK